MLPIVIILLTAAMAYQSVINNIIDPNKSFKDATEIIDYYENNGVLFIEHRSEMSLGVVKENFKEALGALVVEPSLVAICFSYLQEPGAHSTARVKTLDNEHYQITLIKVNTRKSDTVGLDVIELTLAVLKEEVHF